MAAASLTLDSVSVDPSTGVATITVNTNTISGTMFLRIYETDPGVVIESDVYGAPTDSTTVTASPVVFTVPNNGWDDTDYYAVVQRTEAGATTEVLFFTSIGAYTFTRTGGQTGTDFEGNLFEVTSDNVPVHIGARVAKNVLSDVSAAAWGDKNGATHVDNIGGGYLGSNAITVTFGSDPIGRVSELYDVIANHGLINVDSVASYWLRADTPTTCRIYSATASREVAVTTEWKRFSLTRSWLAQDGRSYGIVNNATGTSLPVQMCMAQGEINPYLSNLPPSEFVEDYAYFDYENGNTVDANGVVTEAQGAAITGLEGVLLEGARTRLNSDSPVTQNVTVAAVPHTISVIGAGSIDITGVSTGTATEAAPLTFTPTAGSLTCTVVGSVDNFQVEAGSFQSSYIPGTGTGITRAATSQVRTLASMGLPDITSDATVTLTTRLQFDSAITGEKNLLTIGDATNGLRIYVDGTTAGFRKFVAGTAYNATATYAYTEGELLTIVVTHAGTGTTIDCNGATGSQANGAALAVAATNVTLEPAFQVVQGVDIV